MRLDTAKQKFIKQVFKGYDENADVFLFGSRLDNDSRGGDIDLLIVSDVISRSCLREARIKLFDELGEQKIDTVLVKNVNDTAFSRHVAKEGVRL